MAPARARRRAPPRTSPVMRLRNSSVNAPRPFRASPRSKKLFPAPARPVTKPLNAKPTPNPHWKPSGRATRLRRPSNTPARLRPASGRHSPKRVRQPNRSPARPRRARPAAPRSSPNGHRGTNDRIGRRAGSQNSPNAGRKRSGSGLDSTTRRRISLGPAARLPTNTVKRNQRARRPPTRSRWARLRWLTPTAQPVRRSKR